MSSNAFYDDDIDEIFYDTNCINIQPAEIAMQSPIKGDNQFSILNLNIRSLSKNFNMLLALLKLSRIRYSIIVISETWLHDVDNSLFNIPDYNHISLNRCNSMKGGGLRIYYHHSIKFIQIDSRLTGVHDSHECLSCEFSLINKTKLHIVAIYRPPNKSLRSFMNEIKSRKVNHNDIQSNNIKIIAGDMNIAYDSDVTKLPRIQQEYFETFRSNSFKFHITKPTRLGRAGNNDTIIDHIWSNCFLDSFAFTINYKISDHIPAAVLFDYEIPTKPIKLKFFDFSCQNIETFFPEKRNIFEPLINYSYQINDVETSTDHISSELYQIAKKHFPIRSQQISYKKLNTPWLTKYMIKCLRNKHKLFEQYKHHKIQYSVFRNYSNLLRKLINRSKTIYEKNLLNDLSGNTRGIWKRINSIMRPSDKTEPPFITDTNRITHTESDEISNSLAGHFDGLPGSLIKDMPKSCHKYLNNIETNNKSMILFPATPNEIINIINELKNNNNTRDIPTKLLKLANQEISIILCNLFNKIIEHGAYPSSLKRAVITAVHKKGSKTDISNYRPISVLKVIDKIFEKLLHSRLENFFLKFNLFSLNQFGFTKGKDTGIAVTKLVHEITSHLDTNSYSLCIFADLSKAFDTVNHSLLLAKLYKYGVRGIAYDLIESFLTNRKQQVKFKESLSRLHSVKMGVPQGSCLGPLLFNIYTIDIEKALKNCNLTMYADDVTIEITGNNLMDIGNRANDILRTFQDYCIDSLFSISIEKTVFMIFSNNPPKDDIIPTITLCNKPLKKVDTVCYLGVQIDEKLKFNKHAIEIRLKLNMYKSISRKINNSLTLVPAKIYYFSIVQSRIIYGIAVWGGVLFVNDSFKDLQDKQDKIIRALFAKFFPRRDLNEIYIELNIHKIKQLYKIYASLYFYDIINTDKYPQIKASTTELLFNHAYNTRKNSLIIPLNNFSNFRYNFLYNAVKVWNDIPGNIKNTESRKKFKNSIKKHFTES